MQNVNKVIGLLNEKAPTNHFLAYINPKEANLLKSMGGSGMPGPFGIPSFIDFGDYDAVSQAAAGGEFGGGSPEDTFGGGGDNNFSNGDDIDSTYTTGTEFNVTPVNEPSVVDNVVDFFTSGGVIGNLASNIFSKPENQYAGITGEDGIGEGDYVSTVGDWAESRGLTTDYSSEDLETQQQLDKQAFDAGFRSQSFKDLYETGDTSNLQNLSQSESDQVRKLIPQASYAVGGQQPIESQVNKFFANMGNQSGLSSQLESDYNTAKANVANTLSITPLAQQFGYSTQPYGGLTATNLSTNPFNIEYLQSRGLI